MDTGARWCLQQSLRASWQLNFGHGRRENEKCMFSRDTQEVKLRGLGGRLTVDWVGYKENGFSRMTPTPSLSQSGQEATHLLTYK